ncbi:type III pantothenate kinase [Babesia caballi]|uniref:Type III pantothenate kinase n=1 Tax=Babesia caballi TaxID=5871 RepID=A0AAV4LXB6_BABCB|nr:type III pantothenate kinase [Babesia caballi]
MKAALAALLSFALCAQLVASRATYTALKRLNSQETNKVHHPTEKQANSKHPSGHLLNSTLVEFRNTYNTLRKPVIQYNMVGEVDEIQRRLLRDLSLVFTTVDTCHVGRGYCTEPVVHINVEDIEIDKTGKIVKRKLLDTIKTPDINMTGHRFRVKFEGLLTRNDVNLKQIHVSIVGNRMCAYKFVVELEEPHSYGDTVPAAL